MQEIKIHLKGRINQQWSGWFDNLVIQHLNCNETILSGVVTDQAALYGIISHLRDLGLELISVSSVETNGDLSE